MTLVEYKDLKLKLNRKVDLKMDLKMGLQVLLNVKLMGLVEELTLLRALFEFCYSIQVGNDLYIYVDVPTHTCM